MTGYTMGLFPQHAAMLEASGVTPEHAFARGYVSVDTKKQLETCKISTAARRVPGLLVPQRDKDGTVWGYQYRPDNPRVNAAGKAVKYETPVGQRNGIDVPPGVGPKLADPTIPLWVTEGVKKADAAALAGLCCVALPGVWSWRGGNEHGGKVAVGDWHDIALNDRKVVLAFDSDVVVKPAVRRALLELAKYLETKKAHVRFCHLPNTGDGKTGLDDFLVDGHTAADLLALVRPDAPAMVEESTPAASVAPGPPPRPAVAPCSLADAEGVFVRWLGAEYDLDALRLALVTAAVERLDGDPLWTLLVSGAGNAKTETVQALAGAGAMVTSTITSEGALLSATSAKERTKEATGGLLRKLGDSGVLVVKDMTSILSMDRTQRAMVMGALREVYDGRWSRNVGTDGGLTLGWSGRLAVIGAVTTAWDTHHAAVAAMGDRFVLLRMDSGVSAGRVSAGRRAIGNTGSEIVMRAELSTAMAGALAGMNVDAVHVTEAEEDVLLDAADLVTLCRTAVEYDYAGNVLDAHAPEMPTRFAKQLAQIVRGGVAIGMDRTDALRLAIRCARDSMPPLRLAIVDDLLLHPGASTADVRKRIQKPRNTVDRQLQALHMLGALTCDETEETWGSREVTRWHYTLADGIVPDALDTEKLSRKVSVPTLTLLEEGGTSTNTPSPSHAPTNISGQLSETPPQPPELSEPRRADQSVPTAVTVHGREQLQPTPATPVDQTAAEATPCPLHRDRPHPDACYTCAALAGRGWDA